jgi:hypothetical protein
MTTQKSFVDSLVSSARDNPLAAALVGGGALWLLVGDDRLRGVARSAATAASDAVGSTASGLGAATSGLQRAATAGFGSAGGAASEGAQAAGDAATVAVATATDAIRDRFDEGVAFARENFNKLGNAVPGTDALNKTQSSLAAALERQPLVIGVMGVAIGAALAAGFRSLAFENEYVGEISDGVKADLGVRASAVKQALRENSDTLIAELGDTGTEAVEVVKRAGLDAAQAAQDKVNRAKS